MTEQAATKAAKASESKKEAPKRLCRPHAHGGSHFLAALQWDPAVRHLDSVHKKALYKTLRDELDSVLLGSTDSAKASSISAVTADAAGADGYEGCEYLGVEILPCTVEGKHGTMKCEKYDCDGTITYRCGACTFG